MRFTAPLVFIYLTQAAFGVSEADFLSQYPRAVARIKAVYSQMHVVAEYKSTMGSLHQVGLECWQSGNLHKASRAYLDGPKAGQAGTASSGGNFYFHIVKNDAGHDYGITEYAQKPASKDDLRVSLPLFYAPFCVRDIDMSEILGKPKFKVLAVTAEGDMVRVEWEYWMRQQGMTADAQIKCKCDFIPDKCWALAAYEARIIMPSAQEEAIDCGQLEYFGEERGVPLIKRLEQWVANPARVKDRENIEITTVKNIELGPTPESEFSLASFGLAEPALDGGSTNRAFWFWGNAVVCAAIGGYLVYRNYRAKRA